MAENTLVGKIERGPDYFRSGASYVVEQVACMDGLKNGALRIQLREIAARIHDRTYIKTDIRTLELFRKSSRVLERSASLSRSLKTVIWQMRHDVWLDEQAEGGQD